MRYDLALCIRQIILSLQLWEQDKLKRTASLFRHANKKDLARCIPDVLQFLMTYDDKVAALCVKVLLQIYHRCAEIVVSFLTAEHVYYLFRSNMDDSLGGELLWYVLQWKSLAPNYPFDEGKKMLKLLMRRTQHEDPKYIPCGALRWWLILMWRDLPSMRPRFIKDGGGTPCVVWMTHWLASSMEPLKYKIPLLQVFSDEMSRMHRGEATTWVIATFFEALPTAVSHLQLVFQYLEMDVVASVMPQLLIRLESTRLLTFWTLMLSWTPVALPPSLQRGKRNPDKLFFDMLVTIVGSYKFKGDPGLIETCLRHVAAISAVEENAPFGIMLLSLLRSEFPTCSVWDVSFPDFLQSQFMRFGADPALRKAFRRLGFKRPHPSLLVHDVPQYAPMEMFPSTEIQEMAEEAGPVPVSAPSVEPTGPFVIPPNHTAIEAANARVGCACPTAGVRNHGNTCYFGSIIQSLFHTDMFLTNLMGSQLALKQNPSPMDEEDHQIGLKLLQAFQRQFAAMLLSKQDHLGIDVMIPILPSAIYVPNEQQDVTETMRYIFDKLGGHDQFLIRSTFTIVMKEHLQCQQCGTKREKDELLFDFVVSVPPESSPEAQAGGLSIQGFVNKRFEEDMLTGDDRLTCDRCNTRTDTLKWPEVVQPPSHLLIFLSRQSFDINTMSCTKDKTWAEINQYLMFGGFQYALYFVIIHQGKSADSGHYICLGRRAESDPNQWFKFDDSKVVPATYQDVWELSGPTKKDDSPYVLFYRSTTAPLANPVVLANDYIAYMQSLEGTL
eukprot:GEMP01009073.1.p1 GENE.GEMP01009073.1~~GEMP01009073.1.p1  ORF type:complete len:780 (+),score=171.97 GEMP01009073.1:281-2620(+)